MPLYRKMKSPLGYQNLTNSSFDSYGVDHSGFTTRDELEYQFARQEREHLLMDQEKQNGVTDNFTQYGHNFWGTPQENNYGFGSSNISENIERLSKQFMTPNSSLSENNLLNNPSGYQSLLPENEGYLSETTNSLGGSMSSTRGLADDSSNEISQESLNSMSDIESSYPKYWNTEKEGKDVYDYVINQIGGEHYPNVQTSLRYFLSLMGASGKMYFDKNKLENQKITDKFKHALINCEATKFGRGGYDAAKFLSALKEKQDVKSKRNTLDESRADDYANKIGRQIGLKYPYGSCVDNLKKIIRYK